VLDGIVVANCTNHSQARGVSRRRQDPSSGGYPPGSPCRAPGIDPCRGRGLGPLHPATSLRCRTGRRTPRARPRCRPTPPRPAPPGPRRGDTRFRPTRGGRRDAVRGRPATRTRRLATRRRRAGRMDRIRASGNRTLRRGSPASARSVGGGSGQRQGVTRGDCVRRSNVLLC
jgi:hypothetical protein